MQLAAKKVSLDKCPDVSEEAKTSLDSASQPPVKLVTIGMGEDKIEIGNETVMFRHDEKFYHAPGIGFLLEDTIADSELDERMSKINELTFERVGQVIKVNLVCLKDASGDKEKFAKFVGAAKDKTKLNLILFSKDADAILEALKGCKDSRPLLMGADGTNLDNFIKVARDNNLPLAISANTVDEVIPLAEKAKKEGVEELVIDIPSGDIPKRIESFTLVRRMALRKNFRPLGYPILSVTNAKDKYQELAEAISFVTKYSGLVIVNNIDRDFVLPLLVARQDIYADPQKPVQVEPKIYEIGKVSKDSPVLVTTNFSITYFTVAGEVEASKVPSYLISCDSEGLSVLTAWAAEKFTAEKIAETLKTSGIESTVSHKNVVLPGYVSVLSGKLEEESGWKVSVGPREASGIPNFLRNWKAAG